jgi:hypothetical protein
LPDESEVTVASPAEEAPAKGPPGLRICILGSEAAGKTCFLGGLAILSEPNRHSAVHVVGADQADQCGSPSQRFLNDVARALRAREWPPPTTLTRDVELDLRFRSHLLRIAAIDYAGESFREALNELDDSRQQALIDHMLVADFLLLVLDPVFDLPDESTLSEAARQHMHERQNAHVSGIRKLFEDARVKRRELPRVGLVVTKADLVPALRTGDPAEAERFVAERGGALLEKIRAWGVETACFAVSAVGGVERDPDLGLARPVSDLNPFGYDGIFDWVVASARRRKRQRLFRRVIAPAGLVLFAFFLGMILQNQQAARTIPDAAKDLESRVAAANGAWFGGGTVRDSADALVADELGRMREQFDGLESAEQLAVLRERFAILKRLHRTTRGREIGEFESVLGEADRKLSYRRLAAMPPDDPDRQAACETFLKRFPAATEATEVAEMLRGIRGRQEEIDREKVRRVAIVNGEPDSLNRKATAIMEYVIAHPDVKEVAEMRHAAETARRLVSSDTHRVHISAAGTFLKARKFRVGVSLGGKEIKALWSDGKLRRATWEEGFDVHGWKPGMAVKVETMDLAFINERVGTRVDSDPLSLKLLGRDGALENDPGFGAKYLEGGYFGFKASIEGFTKEDWSLLEQYVAPGLAW